MTYLSFRPCLDVCGVKAWGDIPKVPNFKAETTLCGLSLLKDLLSSRPQHLWAWLRHKSLGRDG